jgi:hypothetical protein
MHRKDAKDKHLQIAYASSLKQPGRHNVPLLLSDLCVLCGEIALSN